MGQIIVPGQPEPAPQPAGPRPKREFKPMSAEWMIAVVQTRRCLGRHMSDEVTVEFLVAFGVPREHAAAILRWVKEQLANKRKP